MSLELFPSVCWCKPWPEISHFQEAISTVPVRELFQGKSKNSSAQKSKSHKQKSTDDDDSSSYSLDMDNYDNDYGQKISVGRTQRESQDLQEVRAV